MKKKSGKMGAPNGNQLEKFLWQNMETLFALLLLRFFFLFTFTFRFYSKQSKRFVLLFRSVAHLPFSDPVRCGAYAALFCVMFCNVELCWMEWHCRWKLFKLSPIQAIQIDFSGAFFLSLCIFEHRFGSFSSWSFFRVFYSCKKHRLWSAYM